MVYHTFDEFPIEIDIGKVVPERGLELNIEGIDFDEQNMADLFIGEFEARLQEEFEMDEARFQEEFDDFLTRFEYAMQLANEGNASILVDLLESEHDMIEEMLDRGLISDDEYNDILDTADSFSLKCDYAIRRSPSATYEDFKLRLSFALLMGDLIDDFFLTYIVKYDWMHLAHHVNSGAIGHDDYDRIVERCDRYTEEHHNGQIIHCVIMSDVESDTDEPTDFGDIESETESEESLELEDIEIEEL